MIHHLVAVDLRLDIFVAAALLQLEDHQSVMKLCPSHFLRPEFALIKLFWVGR